MHRHLFLTGFMGSGKSYWGKTLSRERGVPFVDLDDFIEQGEGKSIAEIFEMAGEPHFRQLEREYLHKLVPMPPAVVATGGGTPCFFDNLAVMKAAGTVVYLQASPEMLFSRLKTGAQHRPLLAGLGASSLAAFIRGRLAEREPFYLQADVVLDVSADDVVIRAAFDDIMRRYN